MNLALFDLDNTLLPIDSDYTWCEHLIEVGAIEAANYEKQNQYFYDQYKAGTLDIYAFLKQQLQPLAKNSRTQLMAWRQDFIDLKIVPQIKTTALNIVKKHQSNNDLCAIVTATNRFITEPIAHCFGIDHLIATDPEEINGQFTGGIVGLPSFQAGKIKRTEQWLASLGLKWSDFKYSYFYSDSFNDLPLLEQVTHPVATNPDQRLFQIAQNRAWSILKLFE